MALFCKIKYQEILHVRVFVSHSERLQLSVLRGCFLNVLFEERAFMNISAKNSH